MKTSTVLVIKASVTENSPRGSYSTAINDKFIEHYKKENPQDKIVELNLNQENITSLNSQNFAKFYEDGFSDKYIEQLKSVDKVVISTLKTNFSHPAILQNYIDKISIARRTFTYVDGNPVGLLNHLKVQLITTQGGPNFNNPFVDHTKRLAEIFAFLGMEVTEPIAVFGTNIPNYSEMSPKEVVAELDEVIKKAAKKF